MKRALASVVMVVIGAIAGAGAVSAQQLPVVTVSGTEPMGVAEQCFTEPTTSPGSVTFTRDITTGALTITYHISGGPTDLNSDPAAGEDHTVDFPDGEATVTVVVHPAIDAVSATVTVVEGGAYAVGEPASGTIEVARSVPSCQSTTEDTLARTGVRSTSGPLALVGIGSLALGSLLLVAASRRRLSG